MPTILRIELIILAVFFFVVVVKNVNKKNLQLKYSLIWVFAAIMLVIIAIMPELVYKVTKYIGIETPSNLIFFISLIWLIGMNLSLTVIVSKQSQRIKKIIQMVSLDNYEKNKIEEHDKQ